eukprot:TRINITY_DN5905_c0_g1_i1.p1 TRINITY_DN5905_c0_g1~~TRINITY_DN5905_c0_g1_i1.p1  ORF type:complete len:699 (+),score=147.81 TRINITY_DN5905_c0_g1_i1:345-2441(+)
MAIQAEWLLDLSRSGLRDLDSNAWQKSIVEHIADLVATFCAAIPSKYAASPEAIISAFKIVSSSDYSNPANNAINLRDGAWLSLVRKKLEGVNFLPVISDAGSNITRFSSPGKVFVLPKSRTVSPPLGSAHLLRKDLLNRDLVGEAAVSFLVDAGMVIPLTFEDLLLEWEREHGLEEWWRFVSSQSHLSTEQKWDVLFDLWCFLADVSEGLVKDGKGDSARAVTPRLPCVPSASGSWIAPKDVVVFEHNHKLVTVPHSASTSLSGVAADAAKFLAVAPNSRPNESLYLYLTKKADADWNSTARRCVDWISRLWQKKSFKDYVKSRFDAYPRQLSEEDVSSTVGFSVWCVQGDLTSVVTQVVATDGAVRSLKNVPEVLVAEPFVPSALAAARRAIFPGYPIVSDAYLSVGIDSLGAVEWKNLFESGGAIGPVRMRAFEKEKLGVWPSYTEIKQQIAQKLEISFDKMRDIETQSKFGWKIFDSEFVVPRNLTEVPQHLVAWLESSVDVIEKADAGLYVQGEVWRIYRADGRPGTSSWTRQLQSTAWVPSKLSYSTLTAPSDTTAQDADLSPRLLAALQSKGISFGGLVTQLNQSEQLYSRLAARFERVKSVAPLKVTKLERAPSSQQDLVAIQDGCVFLRESDSVAEPYMVAAQLTNLLLSDDAPKPTIPVVTLLLLDWIRGADEESFAKTLHLVKTFKL